MTGEEMERAIEFLLKNQADFNERMTRLEAAQAEMREQIRESAAETREQIRALAAAQEGTQQQISVTQRQLDHLTVVVGSIAEATQRNSSDIDALIKLVGGLVEGRDGKSES